MYASFAKFLFYVFVKCLGMPKPTRIQYDIADWLQNGPTRRMIQAFRALGKSWITCVYACWRLWKNPDIRILIVSANEKKATENAVFIKQLIDTVPVLSPLRGGQLDSVLNFTVRGAGPSPSPSVRCDGIFGQITGARADVIIADDIEVPKNSETVTMREKLEGRAAEFSDVKKADGPSEIIYLGTPQTEESIYRNLPAKGYTIRTWTALYPREENLENYKDTLAPILLEDIEKDPSLMKPRSSQLGGAPTDPERFDEIELLERETERKAAGFNLQYMLDTRLSDAERYPLKLKDAIVMDLDKEVAPVRVTWASGKQNVIEELPLLGFDGDRFHRPMYVSKDFVKYTGAIMTIDPSGRGKDRTGYAVTRFLNGMVYLTRAGSLAGGYDMTSLETLCEIAKAEKVNKVRVEGNFGDGMYLELLEPVLQRIYSCGLEEYKVTGQKERRIIDKLEPVLGSHRLVVDRSLVEEDASQPNDREHKLFYQLTHVTAERGSLRNDDALDALAEGVAYWTNHMDRRVEDAEAQHKEELREERLKVFMERATRGRYRRNHKYAERP